MASDESTSAIAQRVLSKDDLEKLPTGIRQKYEEFFSEFLQMKALYETQRTNQGELDRLAGDDCSMRVEILRSRCGMRAWPAKESFHGKKAANNGFDDWLRLCVLSHGLEFN